MPMVPGRKKYKLSHGCLYDIGDFGEQMRRELLEGSTLSLVIAELDPFVILGVLLFVDCSIAT